MALSDRDFPPGPRSGRLLLRMPSSQHERVNEIRRELWFERHGADRRHDDTGSW